MYRETLKIVTRLRVTNQANLASVMSHLATALRRQRKDREAEVVELEALALREKLFGRDHPAVAASLNELGLIVQSFGRLTEAEAMFREALRINRKFLGDEDAQVG